jgi:Fe-Mn family superoxide dismutase
MRHTARNFENLIGKVQGLSERQLRAHFGLYEGYVKKINEIEDRLTLADPMTANYSYGEISELRRRQPVAYNGAYLHELYFENLTGPSSGGPSDDLRRLITADFRTLDRWWDDVKAGLVSAPGWVLLTRSRRDGTLRNDVVEEHHRGVLVDQDILMALDGWEHAYMIDYGTAKADYIEILRNAVDWDCVHRRLERSMRMDHAVAEPAA